MASPPAAYPLKQQRRRAARRFTLRVLLLLALISGVAYAAWLAPHARQASTVQIEVVP